MALEQDLAELRGRICGMLKVADPAFLWEGQHVDTKGNLIMDKEDWPMPTDRTLANLHPQIRRALETLSVASSKGDHGRRIRVAIFALVKVCCSRLKNARSHLLISI